MSYTRSPQTPRAVRAPATSLFITDATKLYRFSDFAKKDGTLPDRITIGRRRRNHIFFDDRSVSGLHAVLERRDDDEMWLLDKSKDAGVFVDGHRIDAPVRLLVGMVLRLGDIRLIAADDLGGFPIQAYTIEELYDRAFNMYGSQRRAARNIGVSHTTMYRRRRKVRRQCIDADRRRHRPTDIDTDPQSGESEP